MKRFGSLLIFGLLILFPCISAADPLANWRVIPQTANRGQLNGVAYGNGNFVAVGQNDDTGYNTVPYNTIIASPDGVNWTNAYVANITVLNGVTYGGGFFVAVGRAGKRFVSTDGTNWTEIGFGSEVITTFLAVTYGKGTFVAIGRGGNIFRSSDGTNWTMVDSGVDLLDLTGVAYGNGLFVAVGDIAYATSRDPNPTLLGKAVLLYSTDGQNWTRGDSGVYSRLNGVTYGNGTFVASGDIGTIITSTNGTNWSVANSNSRADLQSIAFGGGNFVAAGDGGQLLTSADGLNWTSRNSSVQEHLRGVTYGNGTFIAVGDNGTTIQSDPVGAVSDSIIPVPTTQQTFSYDPVASPIKSIEPAQAKPIGVGSVAMGGNTLSLHISLDQFAGPVNIYFAVYSKAIDPNNYYLLKPDNTFQTHATGFIPWRANTTGPIDEALLGDIPTSSLPPGIYDLYLLVSPSGSPSNYYLWTTYFEIP